MSDKQLDNMLKNISNEFNKRYKLNLDTGEIEDKETYQQRRDRIAKEDKHIQTIDNQTKRSPVTPSNTPCLTVWRDFFISIHTTYACALPLAR